MLRNKRNRREDDLFRRLDGVVHDLGFVLVDIWARKDHGQKILRIFADKPGGISLDELEQLSLTCDSLLVRWGEDNHDFLEVQSPGLDRPLESLRELVLHKGELVDISLYQKYDGKKKFQAIILGADEEFLAVEDETGQTISVPHDQVALVKQIIEF